ncbi:hypothetical protein H4R99_003430 [Coemansia sp. RSA 1722]|nr:hypothetical protein IWW45_005201 [Coemansia sp. RSA 485]KAJ2600177.1 hypothetical protein H4R99_003430 [Coemansia sp. RSA 1722]KAJ2640111.1 hypothetical protein GGF40_000259 [Coemansia sp. RSA 1286]
MDYFESIKTPPTPELDHQAHSPIPIPEAKDIGSVITFIKKTCDDLYFTSDSDEPVELYQLSSAGLQMLESDADKLTLPNADDFAEFVAGTVTPHEEGFVAEKRPVGEFFARLCSQQVSERQKKLAESLETSFEKLSAADPGSSAAYYRVGFLPNIEVYVVMLIDGQVVGIKTLSVET